MKLVIERAVLLKALSPIQSVVERRGTIPILANVRLDADKGALHLTATDMDIAIVEKVAAEVQEKGATTVPAHMFYEIIRKLPDGASVQITQGDKGKMTIAAGQSSARAGQWLESQPIAMAASITNGIRRLFTKKTTTIKKINLR